MRSFESRPVIMLIKVTWPDLLISVMDTLPVASRAESNRPGSSQTYDFKRCFTSVSDIKVL